VSCKDNAGKGEAVVMSRKDVLNQEPETHESYGMVSFSRISSSPAQALFGSSVKHGNIISMKVHKGRKYRDFQSDRYSSDGTLCEVFMSQTQFAEAITSFNIGDGVPCTLKMVTGDEWDAEKRGFREDCPEVNFRKQTTEELNEELSELGDRVEAMAGDVKEILSAKGQVKASDKKKLLDGLESVLQEVRSNIPFVHQCFNRSVNKAVTEAKGEIDATYQAMREKLGDRVIEGKVELPSLGEGDE